jgi:hypothetical protein
MPEGSGRGGASPETLIRPMRTDVRTLRSSSASAIPGSWKGSWYQAASSVCGMTLVGGTGSRAATAR